MSFELYSEYLSLNESFKQFAYKVGLSFKLKKAEFDFELEMDKGENKNRELLKDLAKHKKELETEIDNISEDSIISREDILLKCNILLSRLKKSYSVALAEDSGNDENIEQVINQVKRTKEKIVNFDFESPVDNNQDALISTKEVI